MAKLPWPQEVNPTVLMIIQLISNVKPELCASLKFFVWREPMCL